MTQKADKRNQILHICGGASQSKDTDAMALTHVKRELKKRGIKHHKLVMIRHADRG